jgi:hypothetical protein
MVAALTVYSRIGDRHEVLALTRTVLAGDRLVDADFKVVSISTDDSLASVPASARPSLVSQYAKVRMLAGSLVVGESVQPRPLVDPTKVLMSVAVPVSGVPSGLREGSHVMLIVTPATPPAAPVLVEAMVAAVPRDLAGQVGVATSTAATVALSVEVDPAAAATVGTAKAVAVGVLPPGASFPQPVTPAEGG